MPMPPCIWTPSRTASVGDVRRLGLGDRDVELGALVAAVEQLLRLERRGAGDLDFAIEVRGAVLERLEFADQLAELLALLEIVDGHRRCARGDADQLGRGARAAGVERALQRRPAAVDLADHRVGVELDIVEGQPRRFRAVDQRDVLDLRPPRPWAPRTG